jgi:hypothetical protein
MIRAQLEAPRPVILPPRPNLGPEPLPPLDDPSYPSFAWIVGAALLALGFLFWAVYARRRKRPASKRGPETPPDPHEPVDIAADSLLSAAERARMLVASRFGRDRLAFTTEELTSDSAIALALTSTTRARLEALLQAADHAKFAPRDDVSLDGQGWDDFLTTLRRELSGSGPSATKSTTTGK